MSALDKTLADYYHRRIGNGPRKVEAPPIVIGQDEAVEVTPGEADDIDLNEVVTKLATLTDDVCRRCVISKIYRDYLRALVKARAAA